MVKPAGRFRTFMSELKRRRVFRVASIYLVAAWLMVQVAATVAPILNLDYLPRFILIGVLIGFPVALVLAWAFDVTAEGLERTDMYGQPTVLRGRWLRPVVAFFTIMLLVSGAYFAWVRLTRPAEEKGTAIAVFPFEVQGGGSLVYLHEGIVHLLSTKLEGAGTLRSVDPDVLLRAIAQEPDEADVTVDVARRIARRFGASAFIMGDVSEVGGTITLSGSLHNVSDEEGAPTVASASGTEDDLFTIVDNLAKSLITAQFNVPATRMLRTAGLTTGSLPALKAYLNGEVDYRGARWRNAMDWYKLALVEDSAFALASYRLADAAEWAADFDVVLPAAAQAYRHREHLSRRDRALVEAMNDWVNGRIDPAEKAYREITTNYPEEVEAWYKLGEILYHYNPLRGRSALDAGVAFENAARLDPSQEPIVFHLTEIALYRRDFTAFDSLMKRVKLDGGAALRRTAIKTFATKDPRGIDSVMTALRGASDGTLSFVANGLAQYIHDIDNAERVALLMTDAARPAPVRGSAYVLLAQLDVARGRWKSALQRWAALEKIHRPSALEYHALYAAIPFFRAPPIELRQVRADLENWNAAAEPDVDSYSAFLAVNNGAHAAIRAYTIGLMSAALKENDAAESQAAMLNRLADSTSVGHLSSRLASGVLAYVEAVSGKHAVAIERLNKMNVDASLDPITHSAFYAHTNERFILGEAQYQLGKYREALPWFQAMIQGHNELYLLGPSYLRRAQIYEKIGEQRLAEQHYRAFADLWAEADPEFQGLVTDARAKLPRQTARR